MTKAKDEETVKKCLTTLRSFRTKLNNHLDKPYVSDLLQVRIREFVRVVNEALDKPWKNDRHFSTYRNQLHEEYMQIGRQITSAIVEYDNDVQLPEPEQDTPNNIVAEDDEDATLYEDIQNNNDTPPVQTVVLEELQAADPEGTKPKRTREPGAGRPSVGVYKRLKLTMPETSWQFIDEQITRKRFDSYSEFFRYLTQQYMEVKRNESDPEP